MMLQKTKVLLCSPHGKVVGGIQKWTEHVMRYFEEINSNIYIEQFYPDSDVECNRSSFIIRAYIGIKTFLPFIFKLSHKLKANSFDTVHVASSASISLLKDIAVLRIAKKRKVRTVIHFHFGRIPELYAKLNWEQKLLHRVIRLADLAIVIDQASYGTLNDFGYKNIRLLPNPLAPQVEEIIINNAHIKRIDRNILFAGHVIPTKGVFELVQACKDIKNINLKLIGHVTDEVRGQIIAEAGMNHSDWLDIAGEQTFENTIKEMLSAGVFVLPTYTEGFPNVIIEGMACACSIVTTDVGAIPEMLDIENGLNNGICVKPKDVESLREAIIKMLDDREYAISCGKNAQQRVNNLYSMNKVWKQLEELWVG